MTLSTRVSIQWPPDLAEEATKTMVFTTPENHFVDIRIFKQYYQQPSANLPFDSVFEWCLSGVEEPIEGTSKIQFHQEINSIAMVKAIKYNKPLEFGLPDIGEFSSIENSQDRREVGQMENPATGTVQDYIEIWRSLDPVKNSPIAEAPEVEQDGYTLFTLIVDNDDYQGKLIRLGNWVQGLLFDKTSLTQPIHVIQSYQDGNQWTNTISYGSIELFPIVFDGAINDTIPTTNSKVVWKCIEVSV